MRKNLLILLIVLGCITGGIIPVIAQRKMENLGRGVVAMYKGGNQVYVSWRMLGSDPEDITFNLYKSTNSGAAVKLNNTPITATTDFTDTGIDATKTNSYFVKPIINGIEQAASGSFNLPANPSTDPFIKIPLQACSEGTYYVHLAWTGDLDGDGEYDYVVNRLPDTGVTGTIKLDAYKSNGTFLWRIDLGPNTVISDGMNDGVTVFDLDGDGKSEVVVLTGQGTIFPGNVITTEAKSFISVVNGQTGAELARTELVGHGHMGIAYLDGVSPSFIFEYKPTSDYYDLHIRAYDYKNGTITQKPWEWLMPSTHDYHASHQIRILDVDQDGKDEICQGGYVVDDNGVSLYKNESSHGDRFHITDFDPDRPGLEFMTIQQDHPSMLIALYTEAATGKVIERYYGDGVTDVGRGAAGDIDPTHRGVEFWSTQPNVYNGKGEAIYSGKPAGNPNFSIWWDGDLLREHLYTTLIDKWDYVNKKSVRLLTGYSTGATNSWRDAPPLYGDLFGDWREEVMFENSTHTQLQIYTTTIPANTRMYTLMHNPAYRNSMCAKGYYQTNHPDFFVGADMDKAPMAPIFTGDMVWKGNSSNNLWDAATQNWQLNGALNTFSTGKKVLFDISGVSNVPVNISASLQPGEVIINSPVNYTFQGAGALTGSSRLLKTGWGSLTVNNNNSYSGNTTVDMGSLILNGTLSQSKVIVESRGKVGGSGILSNGLTLNNGASILPGNGISGPDTLTVNGNVILEGKNTLSFDLSDDPTGMIKTNDMLNITGNLTVNGAVKIQINLINSTLGIGNYSLIKYSGSFTGNLSSFTVKGVEGLKYTLANSGGVITLNILTTRTPGNILWTGSTNGSWDLAQTSNFSKGGSADVFVPGDVVAFDNTSSIKAVTLSDDLKAASVTLDATSNYTFSGNGAIIGTGGLTKTGSGTLAISTTNRYTGITTVNGGTLESSLLTNGGEPSPLGASTKSSSNIVLNGGTLKYTGNTTNTDRGITLGVNHGTIEVATSNVALAISGIITGAGQLIKTGAGRLTFTNANTHSGGTVIKEGVLNLGSYNAVEKGTGTGTLTLEGGELWLYDTSGPTDLDGVWYSVPQNIVVPANKVARINASGRSTMTGTLTGSGNLTFFTPFIRTELFGNWSAFAGKIFFIADTDGGDFRISNNFGYANASIYLGDKVNAYHKNSGAQSITLGDLSGSAASILSAENWTIGGKNTDAIFEGTITGNSITKIGTGSWTLTNANTYTGPTNVNYGTLVVKNKTGSATGKSIVSINNQSTLTGDGIIDSTVTIASGAKIAPGNNGIGTLKINDNLNLLAGSTTFMDVSRAPITNDLLQLTGKITYGGTLSINNLASTSLNGGDKFTLFKATTYAGSFSSLIPETPGNLLYWDTTALKTTGILSIRGKQVMTFDSIPVLNVGGLDYKISATINSGLSIQFTSSNTAVATIVKKTTGTYVHPVSVGSVIITAAQAGSGGWDPATSLTRSVSVEAATAIDDPILNRVRLFPNPVTDRLQIFVSQAPKNVRVNIYSNKGEIVGETVMQENTSEISLAHLAPGVYTVKIVLSDNILVRKIIKKP